MTDTTKPQSAACITVFETAELAETIFLQLPMRDLLVSVQRTCKQWKAVLDGSRKLQQAMFFEPITDKAVEQDSICFDEELQVVGHPLIQDTSFRFHGQHKYTQPAVLLRPNASWRRQLVSQPPAARVSVSLHYPADSSFYEVGPRAGKVGVTFSDLANAITKNFRPYTFGIIMQGYWRTSRLAEGPTYRDIEAVKDAKDFDMWTSRNE